MNRTAEIFEAFGQRDEHLGYGYIGERRMALEAIASGEAGPMLADRVEVTDRAVLQATADWSDEELFAWANSKDGRWFADVAFGGDGFAKARTYLRKQRNA